MAATTSLSCRSRLAHPLWWAALVVLILNDHLLKSSIAAGWLTGKLSDIAGMIVAPVLLVALTGARSIAARGACFAAVTVPFAAIKLSPAAAHFLVSAAGALGLHWRIWSDWTDLMSFAVLPLAWTISAARAAAADRDRRAVGTLHVAGAILGGVACLATSEVLVEYRSAAWLVNTTHNEHETLLYRPSAPLDCAAARVDPQSILSPELFAFESCRVVKPFDFVPLDQDWADVSEEPMTPNPYDAGHRECDAVVLRIKGLPDTVVFWDGVRQTTISTNGSVTADNTDARAIFLEQFGDTLVLGHGRLFSSWSVTWDLPPQVGGCREAP